jgi:hypothetical protein
VDKQTALNNQWLYSSRSDKENSKTTLALVNATLELERLTDGLIAGRGGKLLQKRNYDRQGHPHTLIYECGDPHLLMHLTGIIQSLLESLGLDNELKRDPAGKKPQKSKDNIAQHNGC